MPSPAGIYFNRRIECVSNIVGGYINNTTYSCALFYTNISHVFIRERGLILNIHTFTYQIQIVVALRGLSWC